MNGLITAIPTGFTAFCATNLDDIVILLLFFSQVSTNFRRRHIVIGQYLGFAVLVIASLSGFFGSFLMPRPWIGMLGILPIAIGLGRLLNQDEEDLEPNDQAIASEGSLQNSVFASLLSPQVYSVAAITFANGGDNIGIYVPLFANSTVESLAIILAVFFTLVGVWCYVAYRLTQLPAIAEVLTRYGNYLVPFVLIGLGVLMLIDGHTLEYPGLTVLALVAICLSLLNLSKSGERVLALAKNWLR
ncbi:cadmium resistance transporter [Tumidithrix elongata RA019]|uniref:Cadmium resistance transporter n=1 Tax=Tumidithrix elongata BACA0141 TaxID=2716417 RepID=A0AAW9Q8K0_9CYAN|nr:cadmium resistance transporter [Tumidithrix elongata RA019]